ncbi:hypothetical protein [Cutibacterium sp.]|uniref:hypothetical protein n=1 Tax=Cutibacterium sp. TaxID=1912221 RepID=UPI0026DD5ED3|nr:hypothetical protein [Cutibacterium sp.]MDO4412049.1 hypothetical protein [Cutibacterium sp.]
MIPPSEQNPRSSALHRGLPASIVVGAVATWGSTVALLSVAIAVMVSGHSIFSAGVAAMLVIYAILVALVGWLAIKGRSSAQGLMVASGLLHVIVLVSLQRSGGPAWFWVLAVIPAAAVVAALLPQSRAWLRD